MSVDPFSTLGFARTLAHVGSPQYVESWRTHVLVRPCADGSRDAIGGYPRAVIDRAVDLEGGLRELERERMVSVTLALDCLAGWPLPRLAAAFDRVVPFKTHYVVDMRSGRYEPSRHHRQELRRAERKGVQVDIVHPLAIVDGWVSLYEGLVARHRIAESARFSRDSLLRLAACDGLVAVAAYVNGALVSCHLWFEHGAYAWSHLAASNEIGYAHGAAYAIYDRSIRHFSDRLIDLGSTPGTTDTATDGLARFKAGFANSTRVSYLAGSVLDPVRYRALCENARAAVDGDYFPAYRSPATASRIDT